MCPVLLRTFVKPGAHHEPADYGRGGVPTAATELALHTWLDAPLRELTELLKEHSEAARDRTVRISFALVYPDKSGDSKLREVRSLMWKRLTHLF